MALSKIQSESIDLADNFAGMRFGGTASDNALNDYEEGTWTPDLNQSGTDPTINVVGGLFGHYVKVGDIVHFTCYIDNVTFTANGSGHAIIEGLPFTSSAPTGEGEYWTFNYVHGTLLQNDVPGGYINKGTDDLRPVQANSTSSASYNHGSNRYAMFTGSYRAA